MVSNEQLIEFREFLDFVDNSEHFSSDVFDNVYNMFRVILDQRNELDEVYADRNTM